MAARPRVNSTIAGSVLIISRPNWESPSDVPVLLQANIAQPSARDPVVGMMKRHSRPAIIRLASQYGRYGYRRITALLRTEGWHVNAKRVQRIWWREGLKVPQKQPKRGRLWLNDGSCIRLRPCWPNHVWSYDFVMDRTHDGRKFRMLTVIDEFTRRCMAVVVERRLNSDNVLHCLTELFVQHGPPERISVPTTAQSLPLMPSATGSAGSASRPSISSPGHLGRTDTTRASTQSSGTKS